MHTIFVSSTFQDMQFERDILQKQVLPMLQEYAKEYGETVELCDLRWGIDTTGMDELQSAAKILQVCFDEIDRSRPLFIGLLGNRYGWVPDDSMVHNILESQNRKIPDSSQKSVTELEILYNILKSNDNHNLGKFYFRTITNEHSREGFWGKFTVPQVYLAESEGDKRKILSLKKRIMKQCPENVSSYSVSWDPKAKAFEGMDLFAQMVYEDLRAILASRFAGSKDLSDAERQELQMLFAFETDHFFREADSIPLNLYPEFRDKILSGTWTNESQNLYFCGQDPFQMDHLIASLCWSCKNQGWNVIPYDCGLSMRTGMMENLLSYLTEIAAKYRSVSTAAPSGAYTSTVPGPGANMSTARVSDNQSANLGGVRSETGIESLNKLKYQWMAILHDLEEQSVKTMIVVRGLDKLDASDRLWWLPSERFGSIRFMMSGSEMPVGSAAFKEMTEVIYFRNADIFERGSYLDAYMARYHKQLNPEVKAAVLAAAGNNHPQYMELLMQRLLVLDQKDFEQIKTEGNGINAISRHLARLVAEAPRNLEDMVLEKISFLEESIGKEVSDLMLGMLLSAPYGITESILIQIFKREGISISHLSVSMFVRIMGMLVHETSNGDLRITSSPAALILQRVMMAEIHRASDILAEEMEEKMEQPSADPVWRNLIGVEYLQAAFQAERSGGLNRYLDYMRQDPGQVMLTIRSMQKIAGAEGWLQKEAGLISEENISFCAEELYKEFEDHGFADAVLYRLWRPMEALADSLRRKDPSHDHMRLGFTMAFECGQMAFKENESQTEMYLLRAKQIAAEDYARYHNRVWRALHGIELTDEEKEQDAHFFAEAGLDGQGVSLSYGTEIQDMLTEHSWSDRVRIINSYLGAVYLKNGDSVKAELLEKEVAKMTSMLDPLVGASGQKEIAPGVTIINPNDQDEDKPDHYKPDYRRNTAIQLSKEAVRLRKEKRYQEALAKYVESNRILLQIYEDGKIQGVYDMNGVIDADQQMRRIQTECLRDLALNYSGMIHCDNELGREKDMLGHLDKMLEYGRMFDEARNSRESKSDAENYYAKAASVYSMFKTPDMVKRTLEAAAKYFQYYEEAYAKSEKKDEHIKSERNLVKRIIYTCMTENPEQGVLGTDLLLEASNTSVMVQDFENYCSIAELVGTLVKWSQENGVYWRGSRISLEEIYVSTMSNLCMLWMQNNMWDNLIHDAGKLETLLPGMRENKTVLKGAEVVSQMGLHYFRQGDYEKAAQIFGNIIEQLKRVPDNSYPAIIKIQHLNRLISAMSESGRYDEAAQIAEELEQAGIAALRAGHLPVDSEWKINANELRHSLLKELAICYLNHAIALSRSGQEEKAKEFLFCANNLFFEEPGLIKIAPDLWKKVNYFKKNGLPTSKAPKNKEIRYRQLLEEMEGIIHSFGQGNIAVQQADLYAHKLKELEKIHEEGLFGEDSEFARYYFLLYQMYMSAGSNRNGTEALRHAKEIAERDKEIHKIYGVIYSDWTSVAGSVSEQLESIQRAVTIFETLQKRGEKISDDELAMALRNRGLIYTQIGKRTLAEKDVERALLLWKELQKTNYSRMIQQRIDDAHRLLRYIRN